ncbi:MAG: hypothetical protein Q9171_003618 [Xanthocarpia ochracea]
MLSKCEFLDNWPLAAAFIKVDPNKLSSEACVRVPGISSPLFQYQLNGTHKSFTMCNLDRNGICERYPSHKLLLVLDKPEAVPDRLLETEEGHRRAANQQLRAHAPAVVKLPSAKDKTSAFKTNPRGVYIVAIGVFWQKEAEVAGYLGFAWTGELKAFRERPEIARVLQRYYDASTQPFGTSGTNSVWRNPTIWDYLMGVKGPPQDTWWDLDVPLHPELVSKSTWSLSGTIATTVATRTSMNGAKARGHLLLAMLRQLATSAQIPGKSQVLPQSKDTGIDPADLEDLDDDADYLNLDLLSAIAMKQPSSTKISSELNPTVTSKADQIYGSSNIKDLNSEQVNHPIAALVVGIDL